MCQVGNKKLHASKVICYRAYRSSIEGKLVSYYKDFPKPRNNRAIMAEGEPFHAFRSKKQVIKWLGITLRTEAVIYECELSDALYGGKWSGEENILTVTGNKLTILRKVAVYDGFGHYKWFK
jgi:hypothetical protein